MNCSDLETLARNGHLPQRLRDADVVAHLRQCGACEALYLSGGVGGLLVGAVETPLPLDLAAMRAELSGAIEADSRQPGAAWRELSTRRRVLGVTTLALVTVLAVGAMWLRADFELYSELRMWVTLIAFSAVGIAAIAELFRPLTVIERPRLRLAIALTCVLLPWAFAAIPHAEARELGEIDLLRRTAACAALGVLLALPTALCVFFGMRTSLVGAGADSRLWWLAAGLAGIVGNLGLQLHCSVTDFWHLILGHAPLSLIWVAALGVWSRSRRAV